MNYQEINYWAEEIKSCEERKKKEMLARNNYPLLIKYFEGEQYKKEATSDGKQKYLAVLNKYFPNFNTIRSETLYQNPDVIADATKPGAEQDVPVMKSALQYAMEKLDMLTENSIALFDMYFAGFCAVEVNHIVEVEKPPEIPQEQGLIGKAVEAVKGVFSRKEIEETAAKETATQEDKYKFKENTLVRRWNPLDVGFDYRAERIKDIRYVYKIIRMSVAEFNAKYPNFKDKVQGGEDIPYSFHRNEDERKTVTLYEIQIQKKNDVYETIVISPTFKESEIDKFERQYTTEGFNIKIEVLDEYGVLYPISRAQIQKNPQDDINNYLTHMMEVAERNIPKRGYNKNKVKDDGILALQNNEVNDAVPVDGGQ